METREYFEKVMQDCTLSCHLDAKIGIFCEMTKYGFTSINGDFVFARNAKSALVDNYQFEDAI